jgi:hypothetical protein
MVSMADCCASITSAAAMPLSRIRRAGCNSMLAAICASRSGDALINSQSSPLALTAIDDSVRRVALSVPRRTPSQLWQLQFHCGKPPPADEPSTLIFK